RLPKERLLEIIKEYREKYKEEIEREKAKWEGTVPCSIFLPRKPNQLPLMLNSYIQEASYEVSDIRKMPQSDANLIFPAYLNIPPYQQRGSEKNPPISVELVMWVRGIFETFAPLVMYVAEVNPPPDLSPDYLGTPLRRMGDTPTGFETIEVNGEFSSEYPPRSEMDYWYACPESRDPHVVIGLRFPKKSCG
ncbi:MAG: hypothetical protein ABIH23_21425, partial [bacterium]